MTRLWELSDQADKFVETDKFLVFKSNLMLLGLLVLFVACMVERFKSKK